MNDTGLQVGGLTQEMDHDDLGSGSFSVQHPTRASTEAQKSRLGEACDALVGGLGSLYEIFLGVGRNELLNRPLEVMPLVSNSMEIMSANRLSDIAQGNPSRVHQHLADSSLNSDALTMVMYFAKEATYERAADILEMLNDDVFVSDTYREKLSGCKNKNLASCEVLTMDPGQGFFGMRAEVADDKVTFMIMSYKGCKVFDYEQVLAMMVKRGLIAKTQGGALVYAINDS